MRDYICFNGDFIKAGECIFNHHFFPFIQSVSLTENIRCIATVPLFLEMHLERLEKNLLILGTPTPASFNEENIRGFINRLLNKNRIYGGAQVKITVSVADRAGNPFAFLIDGEKLEEKSYRLNEKGLCIDVCESIQKPTGILSGIRFTSPFYQFIEQEIIKTGLDDLVIINTANRMVECSRSNIFLVSEKMVFTPGLSQGCIEGVMRKVVIELLTTMDYTIHDASSLTSAALVDAEEVFLTNTIEGVRWVAAYKQIRYFNKTSKILLDRIKEFVQA
jgi:branched-subunit amino acid aminotransferase/4-amino-4-deoxychorismate lyase